MTTINSSDATETATAMRTLLASIGTKELTCSTATRHRLQGAVIALEAVAAGGMPSFGELRSD